MRSDTSMPEEVFRRSEEWKFDMLSGEIRPEIDSRYERGHVQVGDERRWHSFSGNERNHLFLNQSGSAFSDVSPLSGIDSVADGRSFAKLDFDRDGWQDIALVNANYPLLNVYRNELGNVPDGLPGRNFFAVRLVGGNQSGQPSAEFSNRDGIGAKIYAKLGNKTVSRELRLGEGFAAQNSSTLIIGIGAHDEATDVHVQWPSGRVSQCGSVSKSQLLTIFEDSAHGDNQAGLRVEPYVLHHGNRGEAPNPGSLGSIRLPSVKNMPQLRLITTMATWCDSCKQSIRQLTHLRESFEAADLGLVAVPIDPIDTAEDLENYRNEFQPPYTLTMIPNGEVVAIQRAIKRLTQSESLPSSLVLDSEGAILEAFEGVPTASAIAKWLHRLNRN